ncbi:MAG: helix-turn-helix transcriptional regulator, partial [Anaerohalosphaera sp.]|nr:helix-turn-helix transcriptional regulator [Anaerohalosphaera sp.]
TLPDFSYYYPPDGTEPWEFIWFGFVGKNATEMVRELIERNGAVYDLPADSGIIAKLLKYESYNGLICETTPFDGAKLVTDALGALAASCWSQHPDDPRSVLIRKTQQIIEENLNGTILISDIARQLSMSREHLSRVFKGHLGVSLQEYILRQKMTLACKLLKDTQLSNKEISARLGYDLPTHFARAFKNLLHITPTQFREMPTTPLL